MSETLAQAQTIPPTVEGVRDLSLLMNRAEMHVGVLRGDEHGRKFFTAMKQLRYRQLDQAQEVMIAAANAEVEAGRLPPKVWFLNTEDFEHPTCQAVMKITRNEVVNQKATEDEISARAWNRLGDQVTKGLKAGAEAHEQRRKDLIARGICPNCAGSGKLTHAHPSVLCAACAGSGLRLGSRPLLPCGACGGSGKSSAAGPLTIETCTLCEGSGKYPRP